MNRYSLKVHYEPDPSGTFSPIRITCDELSLTVAEGYGGWAVFDGESVYAEHATLAAALHDAAEIAFMACELCPEESRRPPVLATLTAWRHETMPNGDDRWEWVHVCDDCYGSDAEWRGGSGAPFRASSPIDEGSDD